MLEAAFAKLRIFTGNSPADVARLQKFWAELEAHPNATIALYGATR